MDAPTIATRGSRRTRLVLAVMVATACITAACGSSKSTGSATSTTATSTTAAPTTVAPTTAASSGRATAVAPPNTPAGAQLRWLLAASAELPIPVTTIRAHFDREILSPQSPAAINTALAQVGAMLRGSGAIRLASIQADQPLQLVATISRAASSAQWTVSLTVDSRGLISGLRFQPLIATPASWSAVDADLRSVSPQVELLVANVTAGSCQTLHAIDPATTAPLGSLFKLYVLQALATGVSSGKISWDQPLTVTANVKSLPSGELQNEPDGTRLRAQTVAAKMISISDNTAADMLIGLVGRPAVEQALIATHMSDPARNQPFLTTRELFTLKLDDWPALADDYISANQAGRRALLAATIDRAPLPSADAWTTPRDIATLEWFASAHDICNVYTSLAAVAQRRGLAPVSAVLRISDGGLGLDPAQWQTTWFKGGSEPGVLNLAYLATTRTGRSYVVVALADNPTNAFDETTATPVILAAIKGAFSLAAQSR